MFKDFKNFALKGNVIDLAIGVIIAGAFRQIITSLVNDIFMPAFGILLGGVSFSDLKYVISPATETKAEAAIYYGAFIQSVVDFLIIAFSLFIFIKLLTAMQKNEALAKIAPPVSPVTAPVPPPPTPAGGAAPPPPAPAGGAAPPPPAPAGGAAPPPPAPAAPAPSENQEKLLTEIRDLLKQK